MTRKVVLTRILRGALGGQFRNRPDHHLHSMRLNTGLLSFSSHPAPLPIGEEYTFKRYGNILIPPGARIPPPPPPPLKGILGTDWSVQKRKFEDWWEYLFKLLGGGVIVSFLKYILVELEKDKAQEKKNAGRDRILEKISSQLKNFEEELKKLTNIEEEVKNLTVQVEKLKEELDTVEKTLGWTLAVQITVGIVVAIGMVAAFSTKK